jgi:transposase InsO family protein
MTYPLVRELAEDGIPVTVTCRVLKFSPQGYYKWRKSPVTIRDWQNAHLTNALVDAHHEDPNFGYRFLADELETMGHAASERRVWRLCSDQAIFSSFTKKGKLGKKPGAAVHDDLVRRDFAASKMNELWFTDITEHPTGEGKLYMASIEDAFSGRIVGYSIGERMTRHLACAALRNAIALREHEGTICHSDRGSQFRSKDFVLLLKNNGLFGSMGRVAAAGDNARMESFHSLLQNNVLDSKKWETREELRLAIVTWIERTYHRRRRKRSLGRMTPVEYEAVFQAVDATLVAA